MSSRSLLTRLTAIFRRNNVFGGKAAHARVSMPKNSARTVEYFSNRGPQFEPPLPDAAAKATSRVAHARAIAFYLPQFHTFPENDAWWGAGFTEWRNVARGTPRYRGHYQPRIPADLGCYDLTDLSVIERQAHLAQRNGIEAFCFYYYWFNGKRLMEKPLDLFAGADMPIDFCLMWANENWTRTWDGLDNEILIQQDYRFEDEAVFIKDTARYMSNPNYLQVAGRPLFIVYRASLLPEPRETLARWRTLWTDMLGVEPWLLMAQSFDEVDPRPYGLDGAVEFPPHKICKGLGNLRSSLTLLDPAFTGLVRDYDAIVDQSLELPVPEFSEIKTVSPSWDNDARRQSRATSWYGATALSYERWLSGAIKLAKNNPFAGEPLVFINAWNEWAEGAYLEPDVHYGHAMLNATKRAVFGWSKPDGQGPLLLLGHDAHRHGSQMLLLNLAKTITEEFNVEVHIVLQVGGALVREYQKYARTSVLNRTPLTEFLEKLGAPINAHCAAIANTTVSGNQMLEIKQAGIPSLCLVHELPELIRDYQLQTHVRDIAEAADHVVFPAGMVKNGFESFGHAIQGTSHIQPQGSYLNIKYSEQSRQRFRATLGLSESDRLIINVGYADLRKGFDLFVQTAQVAIEQQATWHFAWIGNLNQEMQTLINEAFKEREFEKKFHLPGFINNNTDHFSAADAFFLTSREDPYPTVVLEALGAGLPFVAYEKCSGTAELAKQFGALVPFAPLADQQSTVDALNTTMLANDTRACQQRIDYVKNHGQFKPYCESLLTRLNISTNAPL